LYFQDEEEDNPSMEDKGTNTIDVMNESFETVELTEGGDILEIGEPGEHEQQDVLLAGISNNLSQFFTLKIFAVKNDLPPLLGLLTLITKPINLCST
jgi:hypothetical protein